VPQSVDRPYLYPVFFLFHIRFRVLGRGGRCIAVNEDVLPSIIAFSMTSEEYWMKVK